MNITWENLGEFANVSSVPYDDLTTKLLMGVIFFNVVLVISATLGNAVIIVTILKSQNLQTPSYILITSLAFTDLLVGMLYQ